MVESTKNKDIEAVNEEQEDSPKSETGGPASDSMKIREEPEGLKVAKLPDSSDAAVNSNDESNVPDTP